jgi:hypothetical protein
MPIQVQEPSRTPNRHDQNRISSWHIINTTSTKNKAVKEKNQTTYKGKPIKMTADFWTETLKAEKAWSEVFWAQKDNNFSPQVFYPNKAIIQIWWRSKSLLW